MKIGKVTIGTDLNREGSDVCDLLHSIIPVSYTHLDVYKRQILACGLASRLRLISQTVGSSHGFETLF